MNSKKAITLLVLVSMVLAMVPTVFSATEIAIVPNPLTIDTGQKGDTIVVTGTGVVGGKTIKLYWDFVQAWDGEAGLLNSTKAKSDGSWEVWFDVPEAIHGGHNIWVEDSQTLKTDSADFSVETKVKLSSTSGLGLDKITATVNGLSGDADGALIFYNVTTGAPTAESQTGVITGDGTETKFSGTLTSPVDPSSVNITDGVYTITDDGSGTLAYVGVAGTINYVTGKWEVTFTTAPSTSFGATYDAWVDSPDTVKVLNKNSATNDVGKVVKEITIPDYIEASYKVMALDEKGVSGLASFALGPVITLDKTEGPSGTVVSINGRGYTPIAKVLRATINGIECYNTTDDKILVSGKGTFKFSIVIPATSDTKKYTITVPSDASEQATADFTVTGLPEITLTPQYGGVNDLISISGVNFTQIKDTKVTVYFHDKDTTPETWKKAGDLKATAQGTISGTFRVPAAANGLWEVNTGVKDMSVNGTANFRVGLVLALIAPEKGPEGAKVTLSGVGFSENGVGEDFNATMGGKLIADGTAGDDGVFSVTFYIPNIGSGDYIVKVYDKDAEITVTTSFTVTDETYLELDPTTAANGYNITISGWHFSEDDLATYDFVLYNSTDEWTITNDLNHFTAYDDGNMTTGWIVYDKDTLSLGTYLLNITDSNDIFAQVQVDIMGEQVTIASKKTTYQIDDTVAFNIQATFAQDNSYIKIYDPSGNLYWKTDLLSKDTCWIKVGYEQVVPFYAQTSGGNPMILVSDAPLGTWTWKMYDGTSSHDLIDEGTFTVAEAATDVVAKQVQDLNTQITSLADQLTSVSGEFDSVKSQISDVAAVAQQAVTAANAAADAVKTVAQTANQANTAAQNAADAANAAKDAANSLTTLVYGAIGAALVAALAAIVSLMQISRRIAG